MGPDAIFWLIFICAPFLYFGYTAFIPEYSLPLSGHWVIYAASLVILFIVGNYSIKYHQKNPGAKLVHGAIPFLLIIATPVFFEILEGYYKPMLNEFLNEYPGSAELYNSRDPVIFPANDTPMSFLLPVHPVGGHLATAGGTFYFTVTKSVKIINGKEIPVTMKPIFAHIEKHESKWNDAITVQKGAYYKRDVSANLKIHDWTYSAPVFVTGYISSIEVFYPKEHDSEQGFSLTIHNRHFISVRETVDSAPESFWILPDEKKTVYYDLLEKRVKVIHFQSTLSTSFIGFPNC